MDETTAKSTEIGELKDPAAPTRRGRGRPRRQAEAFVRVETVPVEKPILPDPRWMAEFIAAFLRAKR